MQHAMITGERRAELIDVPVPQAVDDWVVVKIHTIPMCTEYKAYFAGRAVGHLGHEAVGEVVDIAQPGLLAIGDRVVVSPQYPCGACELCSAGDFIHCEEIKPFAERTGSEYGHATYAQYIVKPSWILPKIPSDISYEDASLALCALGPSFGAYEQIGVSAFDSVLVTGLGPVGLGAVVNARFRGARVFAVEPGPWRAQRGLELGVEVVFDPRNEDEDIVQRIRALTGGKGVDRAIDCSGSVQAQRLCIDATRRKGAVAFVGESQNDLPIQISRDMIRKGLRLQGSWHYNLNHYRRILHVIRHAPQLDLLVSHRLPLSRFTDAFELQAKGECAKILLDAWE